MRQSIPIPRPLRGMVIRALDACPPSAPTRILRGVPGAPEAFGLKFMLPYGLDPNLSGYLTRQIINTQRDAALRGVELQILLINERRAAIERYHQLALNPDGGRILLCAIGPEAESALRSVAIAEQNWPEASSRFDLDGAPINDGGNP